jgi:hypothetical protein
MLSLNIPHAMWETTTMVAFARIISANPLANIAAETQTDPLRLRICCSKSAECADRELLLVNDNNQKYRNNQNQTAFFNCLLYFARITNFKKSKPATKRSITITYTATPSLTSSRNCPKYSRLMGGQLSLKMSFLK